MDKYAIIPLTIILFLGGCLHNNQEDTTTSTIKADEKKPSISIKSQKMIMEHFKVNEAYLNKPGFIVLYAYYGGNDSVIIGVSPIFQDNARDINIRVLNYSGQSPLHAVAYYDNGDSSFNPLSDYRTDYAEEFTVTEGTTSTTTTTTTSTTTTHQPTLEHIVIKDFEFKPDNLIIHKGDTVKWINRDSAEHRIIASNVFNSGMLQKDENFAHTFKMGGVYSYRCSIHPVMKGTIIVEG
ncbi:MAG: cupredoxin domain-containing protein [Candidatus Altiarchaeota archaeon]|nr:cupredoxin domain-containing protein [Candidatus Altiarchaeota archaeon]